MGGGVVGGVGGGRFRASWVSVGGSGIDSSIGVVVGRCGGVILIFLVASGGKLDACSGGGGDGRSAGGLSSSVMSSAISTIPGESTTRVPRDEMKSVLRSCGKGVSVGVGGF